MPGPAILTVDPVFQEDSSFSRWVNSLSRKNEISDRIAVMQWGRVIETGAAKELLARPQHPYTRQLLEAAFMAPATADSLKEE